MNFSEMMSTVVIGIFVVFLVLAILVFFVWAMGSFFQSKEQAKKVAQPQTPAKTEPVPQKTEVVLEVANDNEEEIVAAITAAISCVLATENGGEIKPFKIKSIKKVQQGRSAWNMAGVLDNTKHF